MEFLRGALTSATPFASSMLPRDRRHRALYRSMRLMFYVDVVHSLLSPFQKNIVLGFRDTSLTQFIDNMCNICIFK